VFDRAQAAELGAARISWGGTSNDRGIARASFDIGAATGCIKIQRRAIPRFPGRFFKTFVLSIQNIAPSDTAETKTVVLLECL
jgi:hypothetical protein